MAPGTEGDGTDAEPARAEVAASGPQDHPVGGRTAVRYTPLFRAQHESRYQRQAMINAYEQTYGCRLVVMIDQITPDSVTYFGEILQDVTSDDDLHLMLCSPGGDGEVAVRLVRMAQAVCKRLIVVPEIAKSAATILALGSHEILMGMTSDLGPIDPQILLPRRGFVSAKDLVAAVEQALQDVSQRPDTYPLHAALLGGIDTTAVQFARSALLRTDDLVRQAISSNPDRTAREIATLCRKIKGPFVEKPRAHGAVVGADEAITAGLPVRKLAPTDPQWQCIWALWTRYFTIGSVDRLSAYEGARASQVRIEQ